MPIALATADTLPDLDPDDAPLRAELARRGIEAPPVVWDDPDVDWAAFDLVVIRSTWDYCERRDEFLEWAQRVEDVTALANPAEVVGWNTHKGYLMELEERGAPIVPTAWLGQGDAVELDTLLADRGWDRAVVKPTVDAGGRGAARVRRGETAGQAHLDALLGRGDVMIQPFLARVETQGELSVVLLGGEVAHAVIKRPAEGEFRIHEERGGRTELVDLDDETAELARWVVSATGRDDLLYARVDLLPDDAGTWQLCELELTEPSLYLRYQPASAVALVDAIEARCAGGAA